MASADTVETLRAAGVVVESDGTFRLSDAFRDRLDAVSEGISEASEEELRDRLRDHVDGVERTQLLELPSEGLVEYLAIAESADGFSHEERLRLLSVLDQLRCGAPRVDGSPEDFLPVRGNRLELLFHIYPRLVVYVWREDCPPCNLVRSDLEELSLPGNVMYASVFGPEWSRTLQEEYGITSGPVLVFVRDGEIETRLYGARDPETVDTELEKLSASR